MLGRGPLKHLNKSLQIKWSLSQVALHQYCQSLLELIQFHYYEKVDIKKTDCII